MDLRRCVAAQTKKTEGESISKLIDETKATMEDEAYAVASASVTKRKAESDLAEDSADDDSVDSEGGDCVDSDVDDIPCYESVKPWTIPEWDVDSFDGHEYRSSEEDELSDKEAEIKWRNYKRQVVGSKGFYVEPGPRPIYRYNGLKPVTDLDSSVGGGRTHRGYFAELACICLDKYNQERSKENVVVRGNYTNGFRCKVYITIMAMEKPDEKHVEYECKIWCNIGENKYDPILCRRAPTSKPWSQNK
ncbi:unnamed protein product [Cochlearia groenlandica]